ncbi:alpha/beta hydrolase [Yinghuangia sp. YIM S09857]|uniref:alpha/beta hydrolase n=1 Tax=Yinghuangia sp. YIM S09857 TaxID=3436929 RepID=UPI003F53BEDB
MVTLAQLRDAGFNALDAAAREWSALATDLDGAGTRAASGIAAPLLASGWTGADADAGYRTLDRQDNELRLAAQEACGVAPLVETAATELRAAQGVLLALLADVSRYGLTVVDDGRVTAPSGAEATEQMRAAELTTAISDVLVRAAEADTLVGDAVGRLAPDAVRDGMDRWADAAADGRMVATLASIDAGQIPQGSPEAVRAWWSGLAEGERQRFMVAYPQILGGLDGLPAVVRDRANRVVLGATEDALRKELAAERAKLEAVTGRTRGSGVRFIVRIDELTARLDAVKDLRSRLDFAPDGPGTAVSYLLGFSTQGDGKAVVAVGDPDRARNTAVFVPGMGVGFEDVRDQVDRARDLWTAARGFGGPDTSTITWIGYDTPDSLTHALNPDHAKDAAPHLGAFVDGLRATHDPAAGEHVTVIGHSYGSLVVGEAARTPGRLPADDIVAVGSPGMHANDAAQLGVGREHVWVARAEDDMVPVVGGMAYTAPVVGVTPTDREFGANRFTTEGANGHSEYWSTKHPDSLDNQAAIITGRYDRVRLMWGTPPPARE